MPKSSKEATYIFENPNTAQQVEELLKTIIIQKLTNANT